MTSVDPLENLVAGYPKLAGKMELQPEISVFRRFGALNSRNLLYLQAEITTLEKDLLDSETRDSLNQTGGKMYYARDWGSLSESSNDGDTEQLELVMKIRGLLKEYSR